MRKPLLTPILGKTYKGKGDGPMLMPVLIKISKGQRETQ
jgi:hypothetical protein